MRYLIILGLIAISCTEEYDVPNHAPGIVKVTDGKLYTTYGEGGLVITDLVTQTPITQIFPPDGMNSIDDVDIDGDLIFVLDTRGRDFLAVFSLLNGDPKLVSQPISVEGGPFNGVSASNGNLVVSGGTTFLERFTYSESGDLKGPISFGRDRGHPDVELSDDGSYALVSTDFSLEDDPRFGLLALHLGEELSIPTVTSQIGIEGAGFTEGVTTPTGFPIQASQFKDYVLVAHGNGLTVVPFNEGTFGDPITSTLELNCTALTIDEDFAYIVGFRNGNPTLAQVDLSDIDNPILSSSTPLLTTDIPTSVAVGTDFVYIASGRDGIIRIAKN